MTDKALIEEIGVDLFSSAVFGSAFEDFMTRRRDEESGTIVDEYLRRRAFKESVPARRYLEALRDSAISLYEVVDSVPDSHLVLADRLRGGEPVRVEERLGSRQIVKWDCLACRVVASAGRLVMSGAPLRFEPQEATRLEKAVSASVGKSGRKMSGAGDAERRAIFTAFLRDGASLFTSAWLAQTLRQLRAPPPEIRNSDGDPIAFVDTRWPFTEDARDAIEERLDQAESSELYRAGSEPSSWVWLGERSLVPGMPGDALTYESGPLDEDAGRVTLGRVRLDGSEVVLEANSDARRSRGHALVESILGNRVGAPRIVRHPLEEALAERDRNPPPNDGVSSISSEERARLLGEYKTRYYRDWLDRPVKALGGQTPRQAAGARSGRARVVALLKQIENTEQRNARNDGMPVVDLRWLWSELGLTTD